MRNIVTVFLLSLFFGSLAAMNGGPYTVVQACQAIRDNNIEQLKVILSKPTFDIRAHVVKISEDRDPVGGATLLHYAAMYCRPVIVKLLVDDYHLDINAISSGDGHMPPLWLATRCDMKSFVANRDSADQEATVRFLVDRGNRYYNCEGDAGSGDNEPLKFALCYTHSKQSYQAHCAQCRIEKLLDEHGARGMSIPYDYLLTRRKKPLLSPFVWYGILTVTAVATLIGIYKHQTKKSKKDDESEDGVGMQEEQKQEVLVAQ